MAFLPVAQATGQSAPGEMQGGCFTVSSLGGIGGTAFTPIVNAPEVAILGVSRACMQPVWNGSEFEPRLMLPLSLSYDHRVIDGAAAVRFTTFLGQVLGDVDALLEGSVQKSEDKIRVIGIINIKTSQGCCPVNSQISKPGIDAL